MAQCGPFQPNPSCDSVNEELCLSFTHNTVKSRRTVVFCFVKCNKQQFSLQKLDYSCLKLLTLKQLHFYILFIEKFSKMFHFLYALQAFLLADFCLTFWTLVDPETFLEGIFTGTPQCTALLSQLHVFSTGFSLSFLCSTSRSS